jgi:hypothetical protein
MVSVRDLDWKKDGSLGYFIVFWTRIEVRRMGSIEEFFCGLGVKGGRVDFIRVSVPGLGGVEMHRARRAMIIRNEAGRMTRSTQG